MRVFTAAALLLLPAACGRADSEPNVSELNSAPGSLTLSLEVDRGSAELLVRLRNRGAVELLVVSHCETPQGHQYDPLRLAIDGPGGEREVTFVRPRKAAAKVVCALPPGRELRHRIDLGDWIAGGLARGVHRVRAFYAVRAGDPPAASWGSVDSQGSCTLDAGAAPLGAPRPVWTGEISSPPIDLVVGERR